MSAPAFPLRLPWHDRLSEAGGEALLPAGWQIASESRPSRHCFLIVDGEAVAEASGVHVGNLESGAFVGLIDATGMPQAPLGFTVRLTRQARVLVLEVERLVALIDADPDIAGAWRQMIHGGRQ